MSFPCLYFVIILESFKQLSKFPLPPQTLNISFCDGGSREG